MELFSIQDILQDKSLSYVTTGQSVPDDIEVANIDKITKILLGSISLNDGSGR